MKKRFPLGGNSRLGSILGGPLGGIVLPPAGNPLHTIGALTRVGAGGRTIAAANGTYGPYTVAGGVMTPNTSPVTPGTYDVGGITITVAANRFDVATVAEFQAVASGAAALSFGDEIVLCPGSYNPGRASGWTTTRTNPPSGTWTGENWITVRGITLGATIGSVVLNGTGQQNFYFHFTGLSFDCSGRAIGASNDAGISNDNSAKYIKVSNCAFAGNVNPARTRGTDLFDGINFNNGSGSNFIVENNSFYDVDRPILVKGNDCSVKGNFTRRFWSDGIQISPPCARLQIIGNDQADIKAGYVVRTIVDVIEGATTQVVVDDATGWVASSYVVLNGMTGLNGAENREWLITNVTGNTLTLGTLNSSGLPAWVSGGSVWYNDAHPDHCQGVFDGATDGQLDDIVIRGNKFVSGLSVDYFTDGQGILLADHGAGAPLRRLRIEGNLVECMPPIGIQVTHALDAVICYNTVVKRMGNAIIPGIAGIISGFTQANCMVYGNVSTTFNLTGAPLLVNANNHLLAYNEAAYGAAFMSYSSESNKVLASDGYMPKPGGPIATLSPVPGVFPHQSFTTPWAITKPAPNHDAPAAPDGMTAGMWSLLNPGTGGNMTVVINSLPFCGYARVTDIQYEVNLSGTWVSSGGVGSFNISGLTNGALTSFRIRSVNSAGPSATPSDTKSETPTLDTKPRVVGYKAIAFGGSGTVTQALTGFSGSVTAPRENDVVLAFCIMNSNANRAIAITSAGWTGTNGIYVNDTNDANAFIGLKVMGAVPDVNIQMTMGGETNGRTMYMMIVENVDPTTPLEAPGILIATVANTTIPTPPAITPITADALIVMFGGAAFNDAAAPVFSAPYMEGVQATSGTLSGGLMGTVKWTGGTYTPAALTNARNNAADSAVGITLALRPKP